MAAITTSIVSEFMQNEVLEAIDDEIAQHLFFPGAPCWGCLRVADLTTEDAIAADFNKFNTLTAHDMTEGTDYSTTQALDPTAVALTATEHGLQAVLTNLAKKGMRSPNDATRYLSALARNHVSAIMSKFDTDILTLLQSLDSGVTNTGTNLTNAHILECVDKCAEANMPPPYWGFLHTQQYSDLVNEGGSPFAESAAAARQAQQLYDAYFIDVIYGVRWYVSTRVPTANAAADRGGGIISDQALGVVLSQMPVPSTEHDQSLRGDEILTVMQYAVGEVDGTMGMYLVSDA